MGVASVASILAMAAVLIVMPSLYNTINELHDEVLDSVQVSFSSFLIMMMLRPEYPQVGNRIIEESSARNFTLHRNSFPLYPNSPPGVSCGDERGVDADDGRAGPGHPGGGAPREPLRFDLPQQASSRPSVLLHVRAAEGELPARTSRTPGTCWNSRTRWKPRTRRN